MLFRSILIPAVSMEEPLRRECLHFTEVVRTRRRPRSDGWSGFRVVRILEAAQASMASRGAPERFA